MVSAVFARCDASFLFPIAVALSLVFGVLLVIRIGGADMPTVISLLNGFAGLSASMMGFVLRNNLLIVAGALEVTGPDVRLDLKRRDTGAAVSSLDIPVSLTIKVDPLGVTLKNATVTLDVVR